jgi:hypothetical protein
MQVVLLDLEVRYRPCIGFADAFGTHLSTVMRYWLGPDFGRMSERLAHSASEILLHKVQLLQLAYPVTDKLQLRRTILAS